MVDPVTISGLFNIGKSVIERIWPDPAKQSEAMLQLEKLRQDGDVAQLQAYVELISGQLEINKAEAQHKSIFVAGWRPFIGWTGGLAIAYKFLVYPLLTWVWVLFAEIGVEPPPNIDATELWPIILGMLGLGTMRSYEKTQKVDTTKIQWK